MRYTYTLRGAVEVPEGSTLNETSSGIVLPDGRTFKLWEVGELYTIGADTDDRYDDIGADEAGEMGIFWDGDVCRFDGAADTAQVWPLLADPVRDAAPDLLEALDSCIWQMEQCERKFRDDESFMEALEAARGARSKARGEG